MSNEPENCPHCGVSLLAEPIPEDIREHYSGTHWKREIGVTLRRQGDRTNYYYCPDCEYRWIGLPEDYEKFCKKHNKKIERRGVMKKNGKNG